MSSTQFTRLPSNVVPVNYALELTPNIKEFKFDGRVAIDVQVNINSISRVVIRLSSIFAKNVLKHTEG